ncbi:MAG: transcription-repair coupling factor [Actinomycetales bacterium]|nr:transcription-repair coupling factor [Actinomycetales bacterium]
MIFAEVIDRLSVSPPLSTAADLLSSGGELTFSAPSPCAPALISVLARSDRNLLVVTPSEKSASEISAALPDFFGGEVAYFPAWETLPHERLSPSSETVGKRLALLQRLTKSTSGSGINVLVLSVRSLISPIQSDLINQPELTLEKGNEIEITELTTRLVQFGYERVELIDRRGQFAVRGGIIDVFEPNADHPIRIEFWGDIIDDLRYFSAADQRSLPGEISKVSFAPCRELLLTEKIKARATELKTDYPELLPMLTKLEEGIWVEGAESLIQLLRVETKLLTEFLPGEWLGVEVQPERVAARVSEIQSTANEFLAASWQNAASGNEAPLSVAETGLVDYDQAKYANPNISWSAISSLSSPDALLAGLTLPPEYRGNMVKLASDVRKWWKEQKTVTVVMNGLGTANRLASTLAEFEIAARVANEGKPSSHIVQIAVGHQSQGFIADSAGIVLLTEFDIFGRRESSRSKNNIPARRRTTIDPLTLKPGDYVVHDQHGVGKYVELISRQVQGATREYLTIEYAPTKRGAAADRLFVPIDQLEHVTKYIGGEAPTLNKLGGTDWAATKTRARKAVRQIASELIRLYAARMASRGYAFSPDTPWQRELEDAFDYVETPDQLATINDVKADMEREVPMDRVICGDVGYGKTEIAVRAAFKAVQDGKQVAIVVPTTLLVQQHYETFSSRYAPFPVKIAPLSRFQSEREIKESLSGISDGSIDVVIGTHRLFSADVKFKDLGLVIVDEEQRFGVEHKEHLKALRTNVDMLTMTATPIPRTLEMAVTGIRELSTIQTPPEERLPVLTSVGSYDEKYIAAAIHRELLRDGQVYFVHNRVSSINRVATRLSELVPDARIAIAHGQMNEHELEQVVVDFWEHKFDVLVSTTIIESGLDIPNANTLIVDRADTFGLAQLHQLRGRVGRSRERGYAYFLYEPERPLSQTAHDRLATIAAHTDLGSGMAVAMKDLEIRGAGNLLGGEQSGHIAEVGFDLYVRLVGEAIAEVRDGATADSETAIRVELPVEAHIPHNYLPQERLRLEVYQRLANSRKDAEVNQIEAELIDRFGALPEPVSRLIQIAHLRVLLYAKGITEAIAAGNTLRLAPIELAESRQLRLTRLYPGSKIQPATRTIVLSVPQPTKLGVSADNSADFDFIGWITEAVNNLVDNRD